MSRIAYSKQPEYESDGTDCGIDGDDDAPISHRSHNKFVRRILVGHVLPMHKRLDALQDWNHNADTVIAKIQGGLIAIKLLGYVALLSIVGTFGATVWMMSKLADMLAK